MIANGGGGTTKGGGTKECEQARGGALDRSHIEGERVGGGEGVAGAAMESCCEGAYGYRGRWEVNWRFHRSLQVSEDRRWFGLKWLVKLEISSRILKQEYLEA